jgi:membrane fusion protein (multidrug efflux system)
MPSPIVRHLPSLLLLLPLAVAPACKRAGAAPGAAPTAEAAVAVTTVEVASRAVPRAVTLTGTLTPNRKSDVAADATGKVAAAPIERGVVVAAGAPLIRLDRRSAALAAAEARAQADVARTQQAAAETECARADKLWAAGAINQAEHERQQSACEAARSQAAAATARARLAGKNLGDAVVRAPFRGLVADRFVSEGEFVHPETRVATLVEIDTLRLELSVPEAVVPAVTAAGDVVFQVAAFPGERFHAKVRYVGPAVRRQTRDLVVEAVVANPGHRLLPGMFATARLLTGAAPQPVVPADAIKHDGEVDRAFVVSKGRVEERLVALGERSPDGVAVVSGIKAGERVVSPVPGDLRDGAKVNAPIGTEVQ